MQRLHVFTVTLKGRPSAIREPQFLPGYTFSWSPQPLGAIAYVNASGRLVLMDPAGPKQPIEATKNVLLPAWSADGTQIAFLQRTGRTSTTSSSPKVTQ
jgi:hypothetical protein